ncbi:carbohydrate ABC transporter substrate-binding protein, CUT1 family [Micromonospora rhizosphaerae]|uniref:Carbohydrate ABC transporter substrate-binding protein, CUT1 family n=2 Tax=Micromonospora rhizosphaerae TaxID=568872 RepID=A0A1C6SB64_9ACTN|nr:carbohydrate ABC transporter substrate-binding protein, CUT1 family [Micromonospora rhizosphaerae]
MTAGATACGSKDGGSGSGSEVTMWVYPVIADEGQHRAFWDEKIKAFENQNNGVKVKVNIYPWANREQQLTAAIAAGKGPDAVYMIPDQLPKFYAQNALEPLDKYLSADAKSDYRESVTKSVTVDGHIVGAPMLMSVVPTLCNKKVFEAAGVTDYPKTWDDVLKLGPTFKAKGFDVLAIPYFDGINQAFYPLLWQAGGRTFSEDGKKVVFDDQAGVEAVTFMRKLVEGGFVEKATITQELKPEQTRFGQGKVACMYSEAPSTMIPLWGKENIVALPPLQNKAQATYGTVGSFSMLKGSKAKDATAKWLNYITSTEVMAAYDKASGYFAPRKSVPPQYADDPVLGKCEEMLNYASPGELHPKARDVQGVLRPLVQAAIIGQKTPEQAMQEAAKQANQLLG